MAESLILIEHDRQQLKRPSLHAIALARQLGDDYALLVLGHSLDGIATTRYWRNRWPTVMRQ